MPQSIFIDSNSYKHHMMRWRPDLHLVSVEFGVGTLLSEPSGTIISITNIVKNRPLFKYLELFLSMLFGIKRTAV